MAAPLPIIKVPSVEGKNIPFEDRRSEGRSQRWPDLVAELVQLKVHVIVIAGTPAALAAKRATIPIVMAVIGDPLSTGLVANLAHPGGNVTGLTNFGPGLAAKRLELLKEVVPGRSRVAFLWNPGNQPPSRWRMSRPARQRLRPPGRGGSPDSS